MVSSSPDVDSESLPCILAAPQPPDLCAPYASAAPPPPPEMGQSHLLYPPGPFSSPSDSMLSESDLEGGFANGGGGGQADSSPRSAASSSPSGGKPASALVLGRQYKSVITAAPDFARLAASKPPPPQPYPAPQRTFSDSPYNDACYFESARHMEAASGVKYGEYGAEVQPQYTSVIVDAQQYQQMANGFVH